MSSDNGMLAPTQLAPDLNAIVIRWLGTKAYQPIWQAMQTFTQNRDEKTPDEIWLLEHEAVFTQGQNGKAEHLLDAGDIPVIQTDRGGQITYHGPGQLVLYLLLDLRRRKLNVRTLVTALEEAVIALLASYAISAYAKKSAPGVYVRQHLATAKTRAKAIDSDVPDERKICSIGLRIRKGCSYHGIAFNIAMDLTPFKRINPCGFNNLSMIDCKNLNGPTEVREVGTELAAFLINNLQ